MISAFRAQGEHTTGTARAGAWQRTRGPFAIDIPEAAGAGVCLLLPCPRLRGARAGIQAAACPRQVLLLPRVQEEKGSFAAKERYHPLGAQLSSAQGKVRRGKGEEKQRDQEEFQLQIPARIFSGFLLVSCAFHTPQLCGMSFLPSLCPVPVSLCEHPAHRQQTPRLAFSRLENCQLLGGGTRFYFAVISPGKALRSAELCFCRGVCRVPVPGRAAAPVGAGEVSSVELWGSCPDLVPSPQRCSGSAWQRPWPTSRNSGSIRCPSWCRKAPSSSGSME